MFFCWFQVPVQIIGDSPRFYIGNGKSELQFDVRAIAAKMWLKQVIHSRYKRMVLQQELVFLATVLCVGVGILLAFFRKQELEIEKEEEYVQAAAMPSDAASDRAEEQKIEEMYDMA